MLGSHGRFTRSRWSPEQSGWGKEHRQSHGDTQPWGHRDCEDDANGKHRPQAQEACHSAQTCFLSRRMCSAPREARKTKPYVKSPGFEVLMMLFLKLLHTVGHTEHTCRMVNLVGHRFLGDAQYPSGAVLVLEEEAQVARGKVMQIPSVR